MHVLSISPRFSVNGVTVHVDALNDRVVRDGHRLTSIPLSTTTPIVEHRLGPRREVWSASPTWGGDWFEEKLRLVDATVETFHATARHPVDLIHTHDWLAGHAGTLLAQRLGCPHLATVHTLTELERQEAGLPGRLPPHAGQIRLEKALCSAPTALLTVSQALRQKIETLGSPGALDLDVVPNGLAAAPAPPAREVASLRAQLAPAGQSIVLFVGRLAPQKGLDFLLASSFAVLEARPDTVWVVVGDHVASHMMRPVYRSILEEGGSERHVRFVGEVDPDRVDLYYRAADCLVVPSLYEGCPYVVLEAMRAEIPIVATDLPALREILTDRETALLVPRDEDAAIRGPDARRLAQAQLQLLAEPELRRSLVERARRVVHERFPLERQLERTLDRYHHLATVNVPTAACSA